MSHPIHLSGLTDREAIRDAIFRLVTAFDTYDRSLLESAVTNDSTFDLNGRGSAGIEALCKDLLDHAGPLDTMHYVSNVRINHENGSDTAYMTAYLQAHHFRKGEGMEFAADTFLSGSMFLMDLVRDGDLWKIKKTTMKLMFGQGNFKIMDR